MNAVTPNRRKSLACDEPGRRPPLRGRLITRHETQELLSIKSTSFWRLVSQEKLRLVSIGLGHRRVVGDSVADLIEGAASSTASSNTAPVSK